MPPFKRPFSSSPKRERRFGGSNGPSRFNGPRERSFEKFDAICSNCGKRCQVPFRPNGVKPVYCSDCFGAPGVSRDKAASPSRHSFAPAEPRTGTKSLADLERQIGAMNTKIDTMLRILESISVDEEEAEEFEAPMAEAEPKPASAPARAKKAPRSKPKR